MEYSVVLIHIFILFLLILVGYLAGIGKAVSPDSSKELTNLLMKVTLPATIFSSMIRSYDVGMLKSSGYILFLGFFSFLLCMGIAYLMSRALAVPKKRRGIWVFASTFSNAGFMGFPIISALLGAEGLFLAAVMNLSFNVLVYTVGIKLVGSKNANIELKKVIISNINIAMVVGLFFFITQIPIPEPILTAVNYFGSITTPLSMFLIGLSISKGKISSVFKSKDAFIVSLNRLLIMPVLVFLILKLFPFETESIIPQVVAITIAMPAASATLILAEQYDGDTELAATIIFVSSLFSIVTIPLILLLL